MEGREDPECGEQVFSDRLGLHDVSQRAHLDSGAEELRHARCTREGVEGPGRLPTQSLRSYNSYLKMF